ncbi:inner membrane protein YhaH [Oxalicibacterium flavum]|uniref:Inner membrane protein YhaH n=1 Tax=Oxalicibacterium flavum TaxID=179467 RepID=A0A8J2UNY6_9BURK|nr:DUF805 domain-containing protein [Oxalicibacterium flavum]GGB98462.1 inner membrane protein YhaH [Oxalicibacterium flavum]
MTFTESIRTCFRKYADFKGRATRSEFWWWVLFNVIAAFVLGLISERLPQLLSLALLLPNIAVSARRLHDTDRSGWWQLIGFVPIIGWIVLVIWYVQDSKQTTRFD